jgi:hypothetical protein
LPDPESRRQGVDHRCEQRWRPIAHRLGEDRLLILGSPEFPGGPAQNELCHQMAGLWLLSARAANLRLINQK